MRTHTEVSDPQRLVPAPVVSVLMLVYNHAPWLAEAIQSVMDQDCGFPFELIIGEDCSSDDSRAIALQYQQRYPERIRVVYPQDNAGASENHRLVSMLARGEFVAWCEGDDYWCNREKLSAQVALLRADEGAAMVHSDWVRARLVGRDWRVRWRRTAHRHMSIDRLQGDLFRFFYHPKILRTCTLMQRRSALEAFYGSELAQGNYRFVDSIMAAYMTARWRVAYWPCVSAVYRESPGSALRSGRLSFLNFLRSALEFDSRARLYFQGRHDYPETYRWECAIGLLLRGLRMGDLATVGEARRDLTAHYGLVEFVRAGADAVRLRWPSWHVNRHRHAAAKPDG